jgi:hypothetical protein
VFLLVRSNRARHCASRCARHAQRDELPTLDFNAVNKIQRDIE